MPLAFNVIKQKISVLIGRGFFHIFGANVINKIVGFLTNIAIAWFLTKEAYGVFSYANNIYAFVLLLTGFGLLGGMFQFCTERRPEEEKKAIYRYALTRGIVIDIIISISVLTIGLFVSLPVDQAGIYLAMFGPLILFDYLFQFASDVFRTRKDNQRYAGLQTINTIAYFLAGCLGAYLGGIAGTIFGRYIAYLVTLVVAFVNFRSINFSLAGARKLSSSLKMELWHYSIPTQISSGINQMTFLLDVFLVGYFLEDAASVASYKVATIFPEGLLFIPLSLIIFALPYFVEHNYDRSWLERNGSKFIKLSGIIYFVISLAMIVLAPVIIEVLWGPNYLDALLSFRLLSACFFFSAIRTTYTNLLCALRATKSNLIVSVISLCINTVLCLSLIPYFGISGAALAPLAVSVVASIAAGLLFKRRLISIP